jgi:hypothetical protein
MLEPRRYPLDCFPCFVRLERLLIAVTLSVIQGAVKFMRTHIYKVGMNPY